MNLKEKFIWNLAIIISCFTFILNVWGVIERNIEVNEFYENFTKDKNGYGTNKDFEIKVKELEKKYHGRDLMSFNISNDPADLNRAIAFDQISGKKRKNIWVSGIIEGKDKHIAILNYKDKSFNVSKGDSVAGGIITDITTTIVTFEKNNQLYTFNLSLKNNSQ